MGNAAINVYFVETLLVDQFGKQDSSSQDGRAAGLYTDILLLDHQAIEGSLSEDELDASKESRGMKSLTNIKNPFHPFKAENKNVFRAGQKQLKSVPAEHKAHLQQEVQQLRNYVIQNTNEL